jgi:hypothetical protein
MWAPALLLTADLFSEQTEADAEGDLTTDY